MEPAFRRAGIPVAQVPVVALFARFDRSVAARIEGDEHPAARGRRGGHAIPVAANRADALQVIIASAVSADTTVAETLAVIRAAAEGRIAATARRAAGVLATDARHGVGTDANESLLAAEVVSGVAVEGARIRRALAVRKRGIAVAGE